MLNIDVQLKKAYEVEGMTPEQIASDQDLDIIAVKSKLMQVSSQYRKACGLEQGQEDVLNFTDEQLQKVNDIIFETAQCAEMSDGSPDYKTRLQAAIYIRDDKRGRKDVVKAMQNNQFNLISFNQSLQQARQGAARYIGETVLSQ